MATSRAEETPADRLVAVWWEIGAKAEIPEERLAEVTTILLDTLPLVRKQPDEAFLRQFRASLPGFLEIHAHLLKDPRKCDGAGHWLVYCIAEALDREPLTPEEEKECEAEYRALYEKFAQFAEQRIRQGIPEPVSKRVDQAIAASMATWMDAIMEWSRRLRRDPLFPCLRDPLPKDALESLTKHYQGERAFPIWDDPLFHGPPFLGHNDNRRGRTPEEAQEDRFIRQMEWFAKETTSVLFHLSMAEIIPQLNPCRYWGYMTFGATGGHSSSDWPLAVTLEVSEMTNTNKGWIGPGQP